MQDTTTHQVGIIIFKDPDPENEEIARLKGLILREDPDKIVILDRHNNEFEIRRQDILKLIRKPKRAYHDR